MVAGRGDGGVGAGAGGTDLEKLRDQLQRAMTVGAGVVRSAASLDGASVALSDLEALLGGGPSGPGPVTVAGGEMRNLVTVGRALLRSALVREETRGAHAREDFPSTDPDWRCRLVHRSPPASGAPSPRARAGATRHGGG